MGVIQELSIWQILFPFIAGAIVVGGATWRGQVISIKAAALFYGLPFSFLPIAVFIYLYTKEQYDSQIVENFVGQSLPSMLGVFVFLIPMWAAMKLKKSFVFGIGIGFASWLLFAVFYLLFICPSPIKWCIPVFGNKLAT